METEAELELRESELGLAAGELPPGSARRGSFLALRLSQHGILLIVALIIARTLGPAGRAHYALPLALVTAAWAVGHLSLDAAAGRLLGRREATVASVCEVLSAAVIVLSLLVGAAALAIGLAGRHALLAGASPDTVVLAVASIPGLLGVQMAECLLLRLGALRQLGWVTASVAAAQLVAIVAMAVAGAVTPQSVLALIAASNAAGAIALAAVVGARIGFRHLRPRPHPGLTRALAGAGLALHPATVGLQLSPRLDLLIVGAFTSARSTGLYSLAAALANNALLASWTLTQTALPTQTQAAAQRAIVYTVDFVRQALIVAFAMAAVAALGAYPFVLVLYGGAWSGSVLPLVILIGAAIAFTVEGPVRNLLIRIGHPLAISGLAMAGVALNAGLTIALIEPLGIIGAALGSVAAYWCYAFSILWLLRRLTGMGPGRIFHWPSRDDEAVRRVRAALRTLRRPRPEVGGTGA